MPSFVIGLDLGAGSVKAAVLKGSLRGYEIEDFLSLEPSSLTDTHDMPSPAAERVADEVEEDDDDSDEADPAAETADAETALPPADPRFEAARRVMEAVGSPQATVVVSIPAERASTWLLDMPFTDKKRIAQTVGFEVENYVPWDLEDVVLDYEIVESGPDGARLFTAMVHRDRIADLLARLSAVDIEPRHIAVDAAALSRLLPISEECEAIIDVGATRALVCVVHQGRPRAVRSLEIAPDELASDLAPFVGRVRASLLAAEEAGAPSIDAVLLTGGGCDTEGLAEALHDNLGIPVELLDLPLSPVNPDTAPTPEPEHALCYALALMGFADKRKVGIDLRRDEFAWKADSRLYTRLAMAAVAALVLLAIGFVVMHFVELNKLERRLEDANAQLISTVQTTFPTVPATSLATPDGAIGVMQEQVFALQDRADALKGPPMTPLEAMKELSSTVPEDIVVDIDEFLANDDMIRIRGQTDSFGSVDRIEAAILGNPKFAGAQKSDVNKARDGKMRFVVTIPRYPVEEVGG